MKIVKNILVGFLVSFIGSIPLGYLNVIGFQIYSNQGILNTIAYLAGVICIEVFVIYFTLLFASRLASNVELNKVIAGFSIVFMFILAIVFYFNDTKDNGNSDDFSSLNYWGAFSMGIFLSAINFIQIPFWTGWNLYLINAKYIIVSKPYHFFFVLGTLLGTFFGMLAIIVSLHYFAENVDFLSKYLMKIIIPIVFLGLGIYQLVKYYKKYFNSKN